MAVYRIINKARELAPPDDGGGVQINPMLHRLLDSCFFKAQAVSIRRLTAKEDLRGRRAAHSLRPLLDDMMQNVCLLTRQNLLSLDGIPMDLAPTRQAEEEYIRRHGGVENDGFLIPTELDADRMEERHKTIDQLCGVKRRRRNPSDVVRVDLFCHMLRRLDETRNIDIWVNKYVAHAATTESRAYENANNIQITLGHLWRAHEIVCRIANILDLWFLTRHSHMFIPSAMYNKLKHLDRPLIDAKDISKLEEAWTSFEKETQQWRETDVRWLVGN